MYHCRPEPCNSHFILLFNLLSFLIIALNSMASNISVMCMTITIVLSGHFWGVWGVDFSNNNFLGSEKLESSIASGKHILTAVHSMMQTRQKWRMLVSCYVLCVFSVSLVTYTEIADTATFVHSIRFVYSIRFAGNDFPEDQRWPSVLFRQSETTGFGVTLMWLEWDNGAVFNSGISLPTLQGQGNQIPGRAALSDETLP